MEKNFDFVHRQQQKFIGDNRKRVCYFIQNIDRRHIFVILCINLIVYILSSVKRIWFLESSETINWM